MDACLAVSVYQKEEHCKVKNRKQPCAFCCKMVFQMPRHLKRVHRDVPEVANADSQSLRKIIGVGIFKHNIEVLKAGRGQLIVSRSSTGNRIAEDYVPCKFCLNFFLKDDLYRHCRTCVLNDDKKQHSFVADGILLLDGAIDQNIPMRLSAKILSKMRRDSVTDTVKSDDLLGNSLLKKLGPRRAHSIAQKMRQLAKLRGQLEAMHPDEKGKYTLHKALCGDKFDDVMRALETQCQAFDDVQEESCTEIHRWH